MVTPAPHRFMEAPMIRVADAAGHAHGDDETWLLLSNLQADAQRCHRRSAALELPAG